MQVTRHASRTKDISAQNLRSAVPYFCTGLFFPARFASPPKCHPLTPEIGLNFTKSFCDYRLHEFTLQHLTLKFRSNIINYVSKIANIYSHIPE
jgi:hypothetical protein